MSKSDTPHVLPVLPLKNAVVYPQIIVPLRVGRPKSLAAVHAAVEHGRQLLTVAQLDGELEDPQREDLRNVGTIVKISRIEKSDNSAQVIVQGIQRVKLINPTSETSFMALEYEPLPVLNIDDSGDDAPAVHALLRENLELAQRIAELLDSDNGAQAYHALVGSITDPVTQMYRIASFAQLTLTQEQEVLECDSTHALMQKVHDLLGHELQVTELRRQIAKQARIDMDDQQREHVLRQQKRAIEHALGETGDDEDITELKGQLDDAKLPEVVQKEVDRELARLARMSANAADYQVARAYLELVAELPWHKQTEDQLDLAHAQTILDEDHYGLEDVKERILESLAVMQLNPEAKAPILCFVGPPGTGKTSLGQSIARAMGRKFERLSLGGLHDEAELRGHRRTYIGAMPGRILQSVRRAGVSNPILMLDEIDKLGSDFRGDPAAALMEILDPAQNKEFRDNYLNLPYDLSHVLFITTANTLDGIPRPLLDRMEVLELSGYSDMEKQAIARKYLAPRQQRESGLTEAQLNISDDALHAMIRRYTREAGVRELERVIGRLARKRARQVVGEEVGEEAGGEVENHIEDLIDKSALAGLLGPEKFKSDKGRENLPAGVAAGLAWTEAGGDVLYVEATFTHKDEKVILTGHLGQVMQESAKAARSYIWAHADQLGVDRKQIEERGIHIHVPAGAVPKDGPSAGVTMATALISAYRSRVVRDDLAMTGELTLSGLVLPVGGIKEKLLAAHRAGMRHIILPRDNEADLTKLPDAVRDELQITLAAHLDDVLAAAFV
ncbi:MAG: endopeptidase La [Proteobacteria bacterium]|nr:endopeptidase La [Pseudomonadota bacterium]